MSGPGPEGTAPAAPRSAWQRLRDLLLAQLRQGITPEKVALTVAVGIVVGLFPVLGITTLLCAVAAFALRLNQALIQLVNYAVYPLQLGLLLPFYHLGGVFGGPQLQLSLTALLERFHASSAWQFTVEFGLIVLGGVALWCALAIPAVALLYYGLRVPLRLLQRRSR